MPARLTHVAIKDYRSIGSCDVELQPLTLLVGPNGSGKSNFLDALRFLRESMSSPLHQVAASRFGILSLLRWLPGGGLADSFTITIRFKLDGNKKGTYTLSVAEGPHNSAVIREELCRVGDDWFSSVSSNITPVPRSTGDRPRLASLGALPQFAPVFNLIDGFRFYEPNPTSMRPPLPIGPGDMSAPNAANVADVYARLRSSHPELI